MKTFIPFLALLSPAAAETLRTASVTAAVNEVQIFQGSRPAHPASVGEKVTNPSSVQTGRQSRTELTFTDNTITRVGQNSIFSFREGARNVELQQGSVLLQVPKNAGGATIRTATVTAAITGTTVMFEYSPGGWVKLLTLEGTQRIFLNGSSVSVAVPAGKMIIMHPNATVIPEPITIDLAKLIASSPLAGEGTFTPLPADVRELIQATLKEQLIAKREGNLVPTNCIIDGPGNRTSGFLINSGLDSRPPFSLDTQSPRQSPNPDPIPFPGGGGSGGPGGNGGVIPTPPLTAP